MLLDNKVCMLISSRHVSVQWKTWRASSAPRWPTTSCWFPRWESSGCGQTRPAAKVASASFSQPTKNVSWSLLQCDLPAYAAFFVLSLLNCSRQNKSTSKLWDFCTLISLCKPKKLEYKITFGLCRQCNANTCWNTHTHDTLLRSLIFVFHAKPPAVQS